MTNLNREPKHTTVGHDYQLETERRMGARQQQLIDELRAEVERLQAELEQELATDHSKRGCCDRHILNGKPWMALPTSVLHAG